MRVVKSFLLSLVCVLTLALPVLAEQIATEDTAAAARDKAEQTSAQTVAHAQTALQAVEAAKAVGDTEAEGAHAAVAAALTKVAQIYTTIGTGYAQAVQAFQSGDAEAATLAFITAQAAESAAQTALDSALQALAAAQSGDWAQASALAATALAGATSAQTQLAAAGIEDQTGAGLTGEGEDGADQTGAGLTGGGPTTSSPLSTTTPSAFSGSGGRPTASTF